MKPLFPGETLDEHPEDIEGSGDGQDKHAGGQGESSQS